MKSSHSFFVVFVVAVVVRSQTVLERLRKINLDRKKSSDDVSRLVVVVSTSVVNTRTSASVFVRGAVETNVLLFLSCLEG